MTTYMLTVEETSQTFPVPPEIGADDANVRTRPRKCGPVH